MRPTRRGRVPPADGRRTPSPRNVCLEAALPLEKDVWFFWYHTPRETGFWDEFVDCGGTRCDYPLSCTRVFMHVGDWRSDEGVVATLQEIGKASGGVDAIVTFLPFLDYV